MVTGPRGSELAAKLSGRSPVEQRDIKMKELVFADNLGMTRPLAHGGTGLPITVEKDP